MKPTIKGSDLVEMCGGTVRYRPPMGPYGPGYFTVIDNPKWGNILLSFMKKWGIRAGRSKRRPEVIWFSPV